MDVLGGQSSGKRSGILRAMLNFSQKTSVLVRSGVVWAEINPPLRLKNTIQADHEEP